ncbi:hypothetical protein [Streptomyces sp. NPDC017086]|uniref:hypothetical protein n=1 Tax=Streptomyces sp. NPDC017086 TaxID=3364976 RepID=UPI0037927C90
MTNRRTRQFDRTVHEDQRTHPGSTSSEAPKAVAARAAARPPAGRPGSPARRCPAPGRRWTATRSGSPSRPASAGTGPWNSSAWRLTPAASRRLAELTHGPLPDIAIRALVAATGMTTAQARALTITPGPRR